MFTYLKLFFQYRSNTSNFNQPEMRQPMKINQRSLSFNTLAIEHQQCSNTRQTTSCTMPGHCAGRVGKSCFSRRGMRSRNLEYTNAHSSFTLFGANALLTQKETEYCPLCEKHCPATAPACPRGQNLFSTIQK